MGYAMESDLTAKDTMNKKHNERINLTTAGEMIKCRVCNKQHRKKECKYQCRWCDMYGSYTSDKCFKKFPHLKKDGKGGKRGFDRSKSRSKSRERSRYDKYASSSRGKSVSRVRSREREDERRREEERNRDRNRGREQSRERERD